MSKSDIIVSTRAARETLWIDLDRLGRNGPILEKKY